MERPAKARACPLGMHAGLRRFSMLHQIEFPARYARAVPNELFRPGTHSAGGSVFSAFRLARLDQVYWRYDQFNRDLVSGQNVPAFNLGYFRRIGEDSRIGADYEFKNRASSNDDLLNTNFQVIRNVMI
jgi:hypothetical protein